MTDFKSQAERLALSAEQDQPGLAAIAYALLALGEAQATVGEWRKLGDYDDLPSETEQE
jgi:hypothetical protein